MNIIDLRDINKVYGKGDAKVEAIKHINLIIEKGEFVAIMGPSGSGKSTLLNVIGCLDKFTEGEYFLNAINVTLLSDKLLAKVRNKTFGFIVQYFGLLNDYTVYKNVQIPLEYAKVKSGKRREMVNEILERLKIKEKVKATPLELSGGQSQRVAIARALVNNPDVILADEPTGALDSKTAGEIMDIFKELNKQGKTVIIVTHDINIADYCNRKILIKDGIVFSDEITVQ